MVSPDMAAYITKQPKPENVLAEAATKCLLFTPLLQYYLSIGLKITKLHYAIQFTPSKPFKTFSKKLSDLRIEASSSNEQFVKVIKQIGNFGK